jgi:hypothetical protein
LVLKEKQQTLMIKREIFLVLVTRMLGVLFLEILIFMIHQDIAFGEEYNNG